LEVDCTSEGAVITKDLTKNFGRLKAVDRLNLTVQEGELFGLLGPNGAGKTTIVRMLCTLIEPTSGSASVVGYDVREAAAEVRRRTGVVSEGVSLYKDLTIEENLKLLSRLYEIQRRQAETRINELLEMFDFREKAQRKVGALSSGWTKKAMICAALIHRPSVLFLDEVTSGLDPQSAFALREFTRKLCSQGVTVIWTTHYMGEPDKICDRIGIIFDGRLIKIGPPDELKHSVSELSIVEVDTPNLSREQLQKLKERLNVSRDHELKYDTPKLSIISKRDDNLAQEVAAALVEVGAKIRSINSKIPSLEEAFIILTGGREEIGRVSEVSQE